MTLSLRGDRGVPWSYNSFLWLLQQNHELDGLSQQECFAHSSGARKPDIKASAGPASLQRLLECSVSGLFQLLVACDFAGLVAATPQSLSLSLHDLHLYVSLFLCFLLGHLSLGLGTTQIIPDGLI